MNGLLPRACWVSVWDGTRTAPSLLGDRLSHPCPFLAHAPEPGGWSSTRDERRRRARYEKEKQMAKKKTGGKKGC